MTNVWHYRHQLYRLQLLADAYGFRNVWHFYYKLGRRR